MRGMSLEVRQMRHVLALAEHGSFARAAMAVGLSQSALSRSIQSVEREAGSQLFIRTASGVEPTDSGRVFIARIQQIVQLTEDLDRDLVGDRGLQRGQLHVGAGPFPAQSMLTDALAQFVADYPRIVVRMMMRDWDELVRRLRAREIEFFVAEYSTLGGETDLDIEPLDMHPMLTYARHGHPLAARAPVSFEDGFAYPYASLTRIPPRVLEPIRAAQRRMPDAFVAQRVFPALEFNALEAIKRIALGSDALIVAPPSCVVTELESGELVAIGSEHFLALRYGIVKLRTQPLSAAAARFREYVLEAERAFTEREKELLERWRPRQTMATPASAPPVTPVASRAPKLQQRKRLAVRGG
jgi:DNA-binding transcriptional LysR family regulator